MEGIPPIGPGPTSGQLALKPTTNQRSTCAVGETQLPHDGPPHRSFVQRLLLYALSYKTKILKLIS